MAWNTWWSKTTASLSHAVYLAQQRQRQRIRKWVSMSVEMQYGYAPLFWSLAQVKEQRIDEVTDCSVIMKTIVSGQSNIFF